MERLRGMYEHSELVLFLQGPNQTAALRGQSALEFESTETVLKVVWI